MSQPPIGDPPQASSPRLSGGRKRFEERVITRLDRIAVAMESLAASEERMSTPIVSIDAGWVSALDDPELLVLVQALEFLTTARESEKETELAQKLLHDVRQELADRRDDADGSQ
jgi:hypothetical protein